MVGEAAGSWRCGAESEHRGGWRGREGQRASVSRRRGGGSWVGEADGSQRCGQRAATLVAGVAARGGEPGCGCAQEAALDRIALTGNIDDMSELAGAGDTTEAAVLWSASARGDFTEEKAAKGIESHSKVSPSLLQNPLR